MGVVLFCELLTSNQDYNVSFRLIPEFPLRYSVVFSSTAFYSEDKSQPHSFRLNLILCTSIFDYVSEICFLDSSMDSLAIHQGR
jgi:hypothetical protein